MMTNGHEKQQHKTPTFNLFGNIGKISYGFAFANAIKI